MLTQADNETLTRVGPGTPMGELMRRYWHPVATSAELPTPDCDPLRTRLLGTNLVVFRDSVGSVGVLDEHCMHRGASLALGRVEEGGIRCLYHGWKYSVDGTVLETPNNADAKARQRLQAPSYPVVERSGLIWTYIGPAEHRPPMRRYAFDAVPPAHRNVTRLTVRANYLQMWEGGTDSSHVSILHSNLARPGWAAKANSAADVLNLITPAMDDTAPQLEIEDTFYGFRYAAVRTVPAGQPGARNARIVPIFLPTGRVIPFDGYYVTVFETPQDDETTSTFYVDASETAPIDAQAQRVRRGLHDDRFFRNGAFSAGWSDRLGQDRAAMRRGTNWSGFTGFTQEDAVISLSMGPVVDRTREHLIPADRAIVRLRRCLLAAVAQLRDRIAPPGAEVESMEHVMGFDVDLEAGERWQDIDSLPIESERARP